MHLKIVILVLPTTTCFQVSPSLLPLAMSENAFVIIFMGEKFHFAQ